MIEWSPKPRLTVCYSCPRPALSVCTEGCHLPFCIQHGISHDLALWREAKLLTLEEDVITAQVQVEERSLYFSSKTFADKAKAKCTACSLKDRKVYLHRMKLKVLFLAVACLVASLAIFGGAGHLIDQIGCQEGLRIVPGGQCLLPRALSKEAFLVKQEFLTRGSCKYKFSPRGEQEQDRLYAITCECSDILETYTVTNRRCQVLKCPPPLIKVRDGRCEQEGEFAPPTPGFENEKNCPLYTRYWAAQDSCHYPLCDNKMFKRTEHGDCEPCPPYYWTTNDECYELGKVLEINKIIKFQNIAGKYEILPNSVLKTRDCPRDDNGDLIPFNDSLGQVQCVPPALPSQQKRPCKLHEVLSRFILNCSFSCPPYKRFNYASKTCEDFKCSPARHYKGSDGQCHRCQHMQIPGDDQCIDLPS